MSHFMGEVLATMILILLGDGVVACVALAKSKGNGAGFLFVNAGWAFAVAVPAWMFGGISGAHMNPAVTLGLAIAGKFSWAEVPMYILAQFIGAILGAALVWLAYLPHWAATEDKATKLGVFSTAPAIRSTGANLLTEVIATFVLVFAILAFGTVKMVDGVGVIPVAAVIWVLGSALGGPTGYALNPARDLGPRIAHAILPIAGKGDSDWGYSWIPVVGPILGGIIAAVLFGVFF